jgi:TolB protein
MLDLAGGARRRLTGPQGSAFAPAWSPNGLIAFSWSPVANSEIYTLSASQFTLIDSHSTTLRPQRITDNMYSDTAAMWSPDGQWIAFVSDRTGSSDVYLMRPDGSALHPVRLTRAYEGDPSWAPGGDRLVIVSNADGQRRLAILNTDGTDGPPLPAVPSGPPARPAWRP